MKKLTLLLTTFIISASFINGCTREKPSKSSDLPASSQVSIKNSKENGIEDKIQISDVKFFSPFTGEEVKKETLTNIPFMTIIENSKDARPQSGLSQADIVFETMAEGGIPRFIAIFQKNSPNEIGPIRSARPYFIDISKEYGLPFAHCGGSEEALNSIKTEKLMSMDEILNGRYYWRDKNRKAPHNLYTSAEKIRNLISEKGFVKPSLFTHNFNSDYWKSGFLPSASTVSINLNKYYSVDYTYKDDEYTKVMDKIPSIDRSNNIPLSVANVVVQITSIKLKNDGSHVDIALIGEGEGYIISGGKYVKITWSRKDVNSPTVFKDESGKNVPLSPGKTWWHILDNHAVIQIK